MDLTRINTPAKLRQKLRDNFSEVVGAFVRNRSVFVNRKTPGSYLDVGSGDSPQPDFCCLDYRWRPGLDVCWNVRRGLPFADGYIGGIFTEHMLEHIVFADALALLKEYRRVLRPGGVLRVIVPDGELSLSEYAKHRAGQPAHIPFSEFDGRKFAFVTPLISINRIFRDYGHKFMWDYETLRVGLLRAGFAQVERRAFGEGIDPKLLRDRADRAEESLYVEAW